MKSMNGGSGAKGYPYLVTRIGPRYSLRSELQMLEQEVPRLPSSCSNAQERLIEAIKAKAAASGNHMCIVWGAQACTFITPNGETRFSEIVPDSIAAPGDSAADLSPAKVEPCFSVPIPGTPQPNCYFLCAKRTGDLVEVMLGEHMVLGELPDPSVPVPSDLDPTGSLKRAEDPWRLIKRYRGQPVTDIVHDAIFGPVQPMQGYKAITLHDPWKHEVAEACEQVAGASLQTSLIDAVWAEIGGENQPLPIAA